jgi:hypothetical protein
VAAEQVSEESSNLDPAISLEEQFVGELPSEELTEQVGFRVVGIDTDIARTALGGVSGNLGRQFTDALPSAMMASQFADSLPFRTISDQLASRLTGFHSDIARTALGGVSGNLGRQFTDALPTAILAKQLADSLPFKTISDQLASRLTGIHSDIARTALGGVSGNLGRQFTDALPSQVLYKHLDTQLAFIRSDITRAALSGVSSILGRQFTDALPTAILAKQLADSLPFKTIRDQLASRLTGIHSDIMQTALSGFSGIIASELADANLMKSLFPVIDFPQIFSELELASGSARPSLWTPERERLACGYFAYVIVWLFFLGLLLKVLGASETDGEALSIVLTMTGLSGHSLASRARKIAHSKYDQRIDDRTIAENWLGGTLL